MNRLSKTPWIRVTILAGSLLMLPLQPAAGDSLSAASDRSGKWELNLTSQYIYASTIEGPRGTGADIDETVGWGFGMGYNFSEQLEFLFDMTWSNPGYTLTYRDESDNLQTLGTSLYSSTASFSLTWNFLPRRFTPFVTGTVGWQFLDTNIPNGPPVDGCWWTWWGYICGPYQPTHTENNFTWGALAGLRFDLGQALYLKGAIGRMYMDTDSSGTQDLTLLRINLGWMFR